MHDLATDRGHFEVHSFCLGTKSILCQQTTINPQFMGYTPGRATLPRFSNHVSGFTKDSDWSVQPYMGKDFNNYHTASNNSIQPSSKLEIPVNGFLKTLLSCLLFETWNHARFAFPKRIPRGCK
jgi:hypothetical protein